LERERLEDQDLLQTNLLRIYFTRSVITKILLKPGQGQFSKRRSS